MKRIFISLICLFSVFIVKAQVYPVPYQSLGSINIAVRDTAGFIVRGMFQLPMYSDTSTANLSYPKNYPANIIFSHNKLWLRDSTSHGWINFNGSSSIPTLQQVLTQGDTANLDIILKQNHALILSNSIGTNSIYGTNATTDRTNILPNSSGILIDSVNHTAADVYGNVNINTIGYQNLQQVTDRGNNTKDSINIIDGLGNEVIQFTKERYARPSDTMGVGYFRSSTSSDYTEINLLGITFNKNNNIVTVQPYNSARPSAQTLPDSSGVYLLRVKANGTTYNPTPNGTIDIGNTGTDTASLSNRINLKLNISDTASLHNEIINRVPYLGASGTIDFNAKSLKDFFISKTADTTAKFTFDVGNLSTSTIRTITVPDRSLTLDNTTTSTTTNGTGFLKGNGSNISFDNTSYGTGTVTSIATSTGILGGTITTSGTLKADTSLLATQSYVGRQGYLTTAVTSVGAGYGLSGGTITTTGTITADTTKLASLNKVKNDSITLATAINGKGNGTVTSVATGFGLSGGTITTTGTLKADTTASGVPSQYKLTNDSISIMGVVNGKGVGTITGVTAGINLTGGGTSGTVTLNADTTIGNTKLATQNYVGRQGYITNIITNADSLYLAATPSVSGTTLTLTENLRTVSPYYNFGNPTSSNATPYSYLNHYSDSMQRVGLNVQRRVNGQWVTQYTDSVGGGSSGWALTGNSGTTAGTNFLGTSDNKDLVFKINNQNSGLIDSAKFNTAFGYQALKSPTTGISNAAFGFQALLQDTSGSNNMAIGFTSMYGLLRGNYNTGVGVGSLYSNVSASNNTAVGYYAIRYTTGSDNTAVGYNSQEGVGNISNNTSVGSNALSATTGSNSTAIGQSALQLSTSGNSNIGVGYYAGRYNTSAGNQLFINSLDRNNLSGDKDSSIIYGVQATSIGSQALTINGNLLVNTTTLIPSASVVINASNSAGAIQGFLPPKMTTTQKNAISSPVEGLVVYDLTLHKLCIYTGASWEVITSL